MGRGRNSILFQGTKQKCFEGMLREEQVSYARREKSIGQKDGADFNASFELVQE